MRATGIVRRIDDLGRVVIPKEIRRTLRIREGDPLEIFTDREGEVILKKYSPIGELETFAKEYAEALAQVLGHGVVITDRDEVVTVAGGVKKEVVGKSISQQLENCIQSRDRLTAIKGEKKFIRVTENGLEEYVSQVIYPILSEGDAIGAVIFLAKEPKVKMGETEQALAQCAASFLGRQMEQ